MNDLLAGAKKPDTGTPELLPIGPATGPNTSDYLYRVDYFQMGGTGDEDDKNMIEGLLTRGIDNTGDIIILDQKESISATTGMYTIVIKYLERRRGEGADNAQEGQ